ncbi:hypothetical protein Mgra_00008490, partial [Meloidogyne graminicola]
MNFSNIFLSSFNLNNLDSNPVFGATRTTS